MKIAVFGGSFDPVHIAHKKVVQAALKNLDIDKIIIVPTYLNPLKKDFLFNPKTRFELLKKVFSNHKKVEISDFEINQKKLSYTYETIRYIKKLYKPIKIYFIIGEDNLKSLHKWHNIEELKNNLEFIVAKRVGYEVENIEFKTLDIDINIDISSTKLREKLDLNLIPKEIWEDLKNLTKKENFE